MESFYQKSFYHVGDDLLNCIQEHFHFHHKIWNSRISWQTADAGRGGWRDVLRAERQIEYLRDWADLETRGHQGLPIVSACHSSV